MLADFSFYLAGFESNWTRSELKKKVASGEVKALFESALNFHDKFMTKEDLENERSRYALLAKRFG